MLAVPIGLIAMRRLRADYQAMAMLVLSLIATGLAEAQTGLVNGPTGLALIPQPLAGVFHVTPLGYNWIFLGLTAGCCALAWWVARGISRVTLRPPAARGAGERERGRGAGPQPGRTADEGAHRRRVPWPA